MAIIYPEGGMSGMTLRQKQLRQKMLPIDTFKVQLVPLRPVPKIKINNPEDTVKLVKEMGDYDREVAKVIHLDTKNQVMGVETISVGSLSASIVHPRETVKGAILNNSANVVFIHNHPSGICEASTEDMGVTKALIVAFNQVGITLLDSVIVGKTCYFSFKEHGLMPSPIPQAGIQEISEPDSKVCVTSDTPEKVEFISAMTDYITAPDLERRKRVAEKIRASRFYKDWADTFFYEHDAESAKKNLMAFFKANEEGLGFVNYAYFGVISEYLRAILKPVSAGQISEGIQSLPIEERRKIARRLAASTGPALEPERKYVTMVDIEKLPLKERIAIARRFVVSEPEFMIGEHVIKDVENDQFFLKHLLEGRGTPEIAQMIKRVMDFAAEHKAVDFRQNVAAKINECLGVQGVPMFRTRYVTPYPPGIVLMVCYGSRGRMHGVWFKNTPQEDINMLATKADGYRHMLSKYAQYMLVPAGAVSIGGATRFTGQAMVSEARSGAEVEIKYEPGKIFPYRVVYAGTDQTVQTREYPEAMAYYTQTEAERAISEEGYTLVKGKPRKPSLEDVIKSGGKIVDDYGFEWRPLRAPKTHLSNYISALTEYGGESVGFYEYKFSGWQEKLEKLRKAREKTAFPQRPYSVSENIQTINNIEVFLNRLTVDTSRYSRAVPIPDSLVIGAAIPGDGFLFAYHVTDDPEGTMRKLRSNIPLCQINPEGDLGCGLYVSGVPEYWRGRSTKKWEFASNLSREQRRRLTDIILEEPRYQKGGGYLADFEVDRLLRDLNRYAVSGDVSLLASTGNQPYNVRVTAEIARKARVPEPKEPGLIKVKLTGKFINAADLYSKTEIIQKAGEWVRKSKPKLFGEYTSFEINKSGINTWLASLGYSGAFTKSGMSTNPEMVVWDRKAIIDAWIPEPQT